MRNPLYNTLIKNLKIGAVVGLFGLLLGGYLYQNHADSSLLEIDIQENYGDIVTTLCGSAGDYSLDYTKSFPELWADPTLAKEVAATFPLYTDYIKLDKVVEDFHTTMECVFADAEYQSTKAVIAQAKEEWEEDISASNSEIFEGNWTMEESSYDGLSSLAEGELEGLHHVFEWDQYDKDKDLTDPECDETVKYLRGKQKNISEDDWYEPPTGEFFDPMREYYAPHIVAQAALTEWCGYNFYLMGMSQDDKVYETFYKQVTEGLRSQEKIDDTRQSFWRDQFDRRWRQIYRQEQEDSWLALKTMLYAYKEYYHGLNLFVTAQNIKDMHILTRREWEQFGLNMERWLTEIPNHPSLECSQSCQ